MCASLARSQTVLLTTRNSLTGVGAEPRPFSGVLQRLHEASGGQKQELHPAAPEADFFFFLRSIKHVMLLELCTHACKWSTTVHPLYNRDFNNSKHPPALYDHVTGGCFVSSITYKSALFQGLLLPLGTLCVCLSVAGCSRLICQPLDEPWSLMDQPFAG